MPVCSAPIMASPAVMATVARPGCAPISSIIAQWASHQNPVRRNARLSLRIINLAMSNLIGRRILFT